MKTLNCWEYFRCGREAGGINISELGICPASTLRSGDGINGGAFSGRYCWTIKGTFCEQKVQGELDEKLLNCISCSFFKLVNYEEGREFILLDKKKSYD